MWRHRDTPENLQLEQKLFPSVRAVWKSEMEEGPGKMRREGAFAYLEFKVSCHQEITGNCPRGKLPEEKSFGQSKVGSWVGLSLLVPPLSNRFLTGVAFSRDP